MVSEFQVALSRGGVDVTQKKIDKLLLGRPTLKNKSPQEIRLLAGLPSENYRLIQYPNAPTKLLRDSVFLVRTGDESFPLLSKFAEGKLKSGTARYARAELESLRKKGINIPSNLLQEVRTRERLFEKGKVSLTPRNTMNEKPLNVSQQAFINASKNISENVNRGLTIRKAVGLNDISGDATIINNAQKKLDILEKLMRFRKPTQTEINAYNQAANTLNQKIKEFNEKVKKTNSEKLNNLRAQLQFALRQSLQEKEITLADIGKETKEIIPTALKAGKETQKKFGNTLFEQSVGLTTGAGLASLGIIGGAIHNIGTAASYDVQEALKKVGVKNLKANPNFQQRVLIKLLQNAGKEFTVGPVSFGRNPFRYYQFEDDTLVVPRRGFAETIGFTSDAFYLVGGLKGTKDVIPLKGKVSRLVDNLKNLKEKTITPAKTVSSEKPYLVELVEKRTKQLKEANKRGPKIFTKTRNIGSVAQDKAKSILEAKKSFENIQKQLREERVEATEFEAMQKLSREIEKSQLKELEKIRKAEAKKTFKNIKKQLTEKETKFTEPKPVVKKVPEPITISKRQVLKKIKAEINEQKGLEKTISKQSKLFLKGFEKIRKAEAKKTFKNIKKQLTEKPVEIQVTTKKIRRAIPGKIYEVITISEKGVVRGPAQKITFTNPIDFKAKGKPKPKPSDGFTEIQSGKQKMLFKKKLDKLKKIEKEKQERIIKERPVSLNDLYSHRKIIRELEDVEFFNFEHRDIPITIPLTKIRLTKDVSGVNIFKKRNILTPKKSLRPKIKENLDLGAIRKTKTISFTTPKNISLVGEQNITLPKQARLLSQKTLTKTLTTTKYHKPTLRKTKIKRPTLEISKILKKPTERKKPPKIPKIFPSLNFNNPSFAVKKVKGNGFFVRVKKGGRFVTVNSKPLTKQAALGLGHKLIENSVASSFILAGSKKKPVKTRFGKIKLKQYRAPKGKTKLNKTTLVEKSAFAINTKGEKKGLSAARILKRLSKKQKKVINSKVLKKKRRKTAKKKRKR